MKTFKCFSLTSKSYWLYKSFIYNLIFGLKIPIAPPSASKTRSDLEIAKKWLIYVVIVRHCAKKQFSAFDF